jgi:transcriptional regulator with XRE-family HTH domain
VALEGEALDLRRTIGQRVREEREARKWNQRRLAERMGAAQSTVSGWESSDSDLSLETLQRIADTFGVSLAWLLGYGTRDGRPPPL